MPLDKWDERYLQLAKFVSMWSKDPSTQTGAVFVDNKHRILSVGYNGFPHSIADDDRLNDREGKYNMIVHCEINALVCAAKSLEGSTLYTYPFFSCPPCAAIMIQAGIKRVVAPAVPYKLKERWEEKLELSKNLFNEARVEVEEKT